MYQYWSRIVSEYQLSIDSNAQFKGIQAFISSLPELPDLKGDELLSDIAYINTNHDQFCHMMGTYKRIHKIMDSLGRVISAECVDNPESTNILTDCLNVFHGLGIDSEITLDRISSDIIELENLKELLNKIASQFDQIRISVPDDLKPCFEVTSDGLNEFSILINLVNKLPSELWRHRDSLFDNPDLDGLLSQLTNRLRDLTPIHQILIDEFSLHRLPCSAGIN